MNFNYILGTIVGLFVCTFIFRHFLAKLNNKQKRSEEIESQNQARTNYLAYVPVSKNFAREQRVKVGRVLSVYDTNHYDDRFGIITGLPDKEVCMHVNYPQYYIVKLDDGGMLLWPESLLEKVD